MLDREKIIKGLRCIKGDYIPCAYCKYATAEGYGRGDRCKKQCISDAIDMLKEQPEQRHGHWKYSMICSVCNEPLHINLDGRKPESEGIFCCPHCGAKMDD